VGIERAEQVQQPRGRGVEMSGELGDPIPQATELFMSRGFESRRDVEHVHG
jgi:hypothetical protein